MNERQTIVQKSRQPHIYLGRHNAFANGISEIKRGSLVNNFAYATAFNPSKPISQEYNAYQSPPPPMMRAVNDSQASLNNKVSTQNLARSQSTIAANQFDQPSSTLKLLEP